MPQLITAAKARDLADRGAVHAVHLQPVNDRFAVVLKVGFVEYALRAAVKGKPQPWLVKDITKAAMVLKEMGLTRMMVELEKWEPVSSDTGGAAQTLESEESEHSEESEG